MVLRPRKARDAFSLRLAVILRLGTATYNWTTRHPSLPSPMLEALQMAGHLRSRTLLRFTARRTIRHISSSADSRFRRLSEPCSDDVAPGRGGLSSCLRSLSRCCRFHHARLNSRIGQFSAGHLPSPSDARARPRGTHFRGHNAFTICYGPGDLVASQGRLRRRRSKVLFPSHQTIQ